MEPQKIKIELELQPEIAFFLSLYLVSTAKGDRTMHKLLTEIGMKHLFNIAQTVMDQASAKVDFDWLEMRDANKFLSRLKDNKDLLKDLDDLSN